MISKKDKHILKVKLGTDVCAYVRQHPRSTSTDIFLAMLAKNPYYAVIIFSQKFGPIIDVEALERISMAIDKKEADKILKKSLQDMPTKRVMRRTVMGEIKRALAKNGDIIFGSSMFGQVHQLDLQRQDAAMWLASRIGQTAKEVPQFNNCIDLLIGSGLHPKEMNMIKGWSVNIRDQKACNEAYQGIGLFFRR